MRISDWSSDVCSSDRGTRMAGEDLIRYVIGGTGEVDEFLDWPNPRLDVEPPWALATGLFWRVEVDDIGCSGCHELSAPQAGLRRSEEHTSELQSLMRISYAVFCLKKKKNTIRQI